MWRDWGCRLLIGLCASLSMAGEANANIGYECLLQDGSRVQASSPLHTGFPLAFSSCERLSLKPAHPATRRLIHPEFTQVLARPDPQLRAVGQRERHQLRPLVLAQPQLAGLIHQAAQRHGLDPALIAAVVHVESRGRPQARSPKGALGLMQIIPATGRRYGVESEENLLDPITNLNAGSRYLRDLLRMFDGQLDLALAAYNAGEGAVMRHGWRIPPYTETRSYVEQVLQIYDAASADWQQD